MRILWFVFFIAVALWALASLYVFVWGRERPLA